MIPTETGHMAGQIEQVPINTDGDQIEAVAMMPTESDTVEQTVVETVQEVQQ